jgi:hypothetical protein
MTLVAISGNDTVSINNTVITGFGDKNVGTLKFPNELMSVKTGKNGNSIFAFNQTGRTCELELRILRGCPDDIMFNGLLTAMISNPPGFALLIGQFIKKIGDGLGNITSDIYVMSNGVISKVPEAMANVEGDTDQSIVVYNFKFANAPRAIT